MLNVHIPAIRLAYATPALLTVLVAATLCGCGENWSEVVPVSGVIKVDGHPPAGAQIVLHPTSPKSHDGEQVAPLGKVQPDGSFRVTTYQADDGAPAGEYVATVHWYKVDKDGNVGPNAIPAKYSNPDTSPIKLTVGPNGPTALEPIAISSVVKGRLSARAGKVAR